MYLYGKNGPADIVTVAALLKARGELDESGGASYLSSLVDQVPSSANAVAYAKMIRERAVLRKLIDGANKISEMCYSNNEEINECVDISEKIIFDIAQKRMKQGFVPVRDVVKDSFKAIEQLYERKELITGVSTGYKDLDRITCGLQRSDLIIVAGRPSMGKTAFALNICENAAIGTGAVCGVFSLEMSKEQLVQRLLCSRAEVDASKLRGGFLSESDWPKLTRAAGILSEAPIYIDDTPAITVLELRAKARRLQKRVGLDLIVVDYLQLMRGVGKIESREREISEISRALKALAKELHIPVIALSQLNRGVEARQDKRPQLSDLRESGAIEQDADVIAFVYRDEMYNRESPDAGKAEILIGKQRNGPTGRVMLAFRGAITRFDDLAEGADAFFEPPSGAEPGPSPIN